MLMMKDSTTAPDPLGIGTPETYRNTRKCFIWFSGRSLGIPIPTADWAGFAICFSVALIKYAKELLIVNVQGYRVSVFLKPAQKELPLRCKIGY